MKRLWVVLILLLAFAGLADSAYLAKSYASGTPLLCDVTGFSDCNAVASSPYSKLLGIPLPQYGVLFYGVLFVLAALELLVFDRFLRRVLQLVSLVGLIMSIWFTLNQVFFIGAFCIYCLASAAIALLVFIFATLIEPWRTPGERLTPPPVPPPSSRGLLMPPMP